MPGRNYSILLVAVVLSPLSTAFAARFEYAYRSYTEDLRTSSRSLGTYRITGTLSFTADTNEDLFFSFDNEGNLSNSSHPISDFELSFSDGVRYTSDKNKFRLRDTPRFYAIDDISAGSLEPLGFSTDSFGAPDDWRLRFANHLNSSLSVYSVRSEPQLLYPDVAKEHVVSELKGTKVVSREFPPYDPWSWEAAQPPPPEHIIVLTHGWQPGVEFSEDGSYLPEIQQAIGNRLSDKISDNSVVVITQNWEKAFVPAITEVLENNKVLENCTPFVGVACGIRLRDAISENNVNYRYSYDAAISEGKVLADRLRLQIEEGQRVQDITDPSAPAYEPTIHFIGHSLGTVVTASAVKELHKSQVHVSQATLLDTPLKSSSAVIQSSGIKGELRQKLAEFDSALLFWTLMPKGSVDYVEDFYADSEFDIELGDTLDHIKNELFLPSFGQPIAGTQPSKDGKTFGLEVPNTTHNTLHSEFYASVVRTDGWKFDEPFSSEILQDWKTPALDGKPPALWDPAPLKTEYLNRLNTELSSLGARWEIIKIQFTHHPIAGQSDLIDKWQEEIGTIDFGTDRIKATSNSPSAFSTVINSDDIFGIEFFIETFGATSGFISVSNEDGVLWSLDLSTNEGLVSDSVYVSLFDFSGSQDLVWTYDSDEIGSFVEFSNFVAYSTATIVPEPSSFALILITVICITFFHRSRQAIMFS